MRRSRSPGVLQPGTAATASTSPPNGSWPDRSTSPRPRPPPALAGRGVPSGTPGGGPHPDLLPRLQPASVEGPQFRVRRVRSLVADPLYLPVVVPQTTLTPVAGRPDAFSAELPDPSDTA